MRIPQTVRAAVRALAPLLVGAWLLGSCAKTNTVLFVNVQDAGGTLTNVAQLKVRVLAGDAVSQFSAPATAGPAIAFPTSFTVELDRSHTGALTITVTALSSSNVALAEGSDSLTAIAVGGRNTLIVRLGGAVVDGGVDGSRDSGPGDGGPGDVAADSATDLVVVDAAGDLAGDGAGSGGMTGAGGTPGTGGRGMGGAIGTGGMGVGGMGTGGKTGAGGDAGVADDAGADTDAGDDADPDAPVD